MEGGKKVREVKGLREEGREGTKGGRGKGGGQGKRGKEGEKVQKKGRGREKRGGREEGYERDGRGSERGERSERPLGHMSSVDKAPSHYSGRRMDSAGSYKPNSSFLPTSCHSRGWEMMGAIRIWGKANWKLLRNTRGHCRIAETLM